MLRILGDCNFADGFFDLGFGVGTLIKNGAEPFKYIRDKSSQDFWIGNFECVCSDISDKEGVEARQFIISQRDCNNVYHLDLYGVANNHVMQHGKEAYNMMIDYIKDSGSLYAGSKEQPTTVFEHQGKQVSITVFNQRSENFTKPSLYWSLPEYIEIVDELKKYNNCDYRIVYVHWGIEFMNYPYNDQKQFAHFLVDSGADLVIGMHPHVMQGFEVYKGKHIFYSLGNAVFNMAWEPTKYALRVNVDLISEKVTYDYLYIGNDYFPRCTENIPKIYTIEYLNSLLGICEDNEVYFSKAKRFLEQYQKANRKIFLKNICRFNPQTLLFMVFDYLRRRLR